ncbi:P-loop containing nucleoside triphosphate hydrolase protein [Gigaspora margarita]|uniref:P-loop containing nucleoside triphosphate hydrolase protein n=1 Tax=Gigaspora margarita TaxID=4874 RepID=A0A8H4A6T9_GIGMA|nr:P-loop containing nucleoside triphosphate hydrolase protein [Gigaspora margarita]
MIECQKQRSYAIMTYVKRRFSLNESVNDFKTEKGISSRIKTNVIHPIISITIWLHLACLVLIRWQNSNEIHCICWLMTWAYASILTLILKLNPQLYGLLNIRDHLNTLCLLTMFYAIKHLHSYYLKFRMVINIEYYLVLMIFCFLIVLMYFSISEARNYAYKVRNLSPEMNASLCSQFMFLWIKPLIFKGFRSTLTMNNIFELPDFLKTEKIIEICNISSNSIFMSLCFSSWKELLVQFIFAMIWTFVYSIVPPYFLEKVLQYIQNYSDINEGTQAIGYLYVFFLFVGTVIPDLCFQQASYIGQQLSVKYRAVIIDRIYQTTMFLNGDEKNKGMITDLMDSDAQKVSSLTRNFFYIYCYPIQIFISLYYLYALLDASIIISLFIFFIMCPFILLIVQTFKIIHEDLMAATDKRVGLLGELLQTVRIVKLYVMEDYFRIKITDARDDELKKLNNYMIKRTGVRTLWTILTFLMMLLSFFWHTKILGNTLTSSVAFTAFILFKNLRHILDEFPSILVSIIQARVSISRIKKFLREFENYRENFKSNHENSYIIGFGNATLQWSNNDGYMADGLNIFTWINLNVRFPYGKLSLIYGPTGCGKTGLLKALLGEIKCIDGHVFSPKLGEVAYAAQTVWLQNGTIGENILFGLEYDVERFSKVLQLCALENEVLKFGDKEIGENGNALSNGQRQRIALARAIYSQHEVLILDDFLSAVDLHITKYVYEQCLTSDLMENRTRILVTHNKDLCRGAAMTVFMKDGKIEKIDEIDSLTNELLKHETLEDETLEDKTLEDETLEDEMLENDFINSKNNNKLIKEEKKAEGMVKFKVYKTYILTSGLLIWILIAVIFVAARYMQTVQDFWIKKWADAYEIHDSTYKASKLVEDLNFIAGNFILTQTPFYSPNNSTLNYHPIFYQLDNIDYYLWVYTFAGLATILLATCRTYCIFHGSLTASKELHNILLNKILSTTIRFYDTTPIGRIINRFSKDLEIIDQILCLNVMNFIYSCMSSAAFVIFAAIGIEIEFKFLIACILIATLYIIIGILYIYASRDLKRLESVSRSPIYTAFEDTIAGISTIRAFGAEERLRKIMWSLIDDNNRPSILNWACNQWLHTHASLAGGLFGLAIGTIIIYDLSPKTSSGLAGLILAYTVSFSRNVIDIITAYTVMEMNMNAVERVHEYLMLEEEQKINENPSPSPEEWLTNGDIQVINLEVGYSPNDPPVLKGISFYVRPREKIGIIGRTDS